MNKITVVIADDHSLFREGLAALLERQDELCLLGQAATGAELQQLVLHKKPDVAFVDLQMPGMSGIEATKKIKIYSPATKIIALTMHLCYVQVMEMLAAGASGYMFKTTSQFELVKGAKTVMAGRNFFCSHTTNSLAGVLTIDMHKERSGFILSEKEKQIIHLICMEQTSFQIGEKLNLSPKTIENYCKNLMSKIGATNTAGIVKYAIRTGLISV